MGEAFGIGAIALALISLIAKIWFDSSKQTEKIIDVVGQNATAMTGLKDSVEENTKLTNEVKTIIHRNIHGKSK